MAAETQQAENPWNGDCELLKHLLMHPWSGNSLAMDDDAGEAERSFRHHQHRGAPTPQRQVRFRPLPARSALRFLGSTGPS